MTPTAVILIVVVGAVTLIAGLLIGYIYRTQNRLHRI